VQLNRDFAVLTAPVPERFNTTTQLAGGATKDELATKEHERARKSTKKNAHKFISMRSLRSLAAYFKEQARERHTME
jgi:hypothetical protein